MQKKVNAEKTHILPLGRNFFFCLWTSFFSFTLTFHKRFSRYKNNMV